MTEGEFLFLTFGVGALAGASPLPRWVGFALPVMFFSYFAATDVRWSDLLYGSDWARESTLHNYVIPIFIVSVSLSLTFAVARMARNGVIRRHDQILHLLRSIKRWARDSRGLIARDAALMLVVVLVLIIAWSALHAWGIIGGRR